MARSNHSSARKQSLRIAVCGMLVALSVVLMLTGGVFPLMTYVSPLLSSVLLLPLLLDFGKKSAWTAFLAAALIVLLLGADKEAAFFYLFLGYYPLLKPEIDRIKNRAVRFAVKLSLFSVALCAMYAILMFLLHLEAVTQDFAEMGTLLTAFFLVMLDICLLLYDRMLVALAFLYLKKVRPHFRFLNH